MTVQELINKLNEVNDKDALVHLGTESGMYDVNSAHTYSHNNRDLCIVIYAERNK